MRKPIKNDLAEETINVGENMLKLAKWLHEEATVQLEMAEEWLEKADASINEAETKLYQELAEYATLEADENNKLSILLSRKATKFVDVAEHIIGD